MTNKDPKEDNRFTINQSTLPEPQKTIIPLAGQNKSKAGLKNEDIRATFIVNEEKLNKIKAISFWERTSIKNAVNYAFELLITKYEKANGAVKPLIN